MKLDLPISIVIFGLAIIFGGLGYVWGSEGVGGEFVKSLIFSLFASIFFYIPTVIFKEYRERKTKSKIITPMLHMLISNVTSTIDTNVFYLNKNITQRPATFFDLPIDDFEALLEHDDLNIPLSGWRRVDKYNLSPKTQLDALIVDTTLDVINDIQNLKPYYYLLKTELIALLCELESCAYIKCIGGKLESRGEFFYDKSQFIEFINIIRHINSFKNSPC